jgi:serine O-acetyltransferase
VRLLDDLDAYAYRKGWPRWACLAVPLFYPSCWPFIVYRFGSWVVKLRPAWLRLPLYMIYFTLKRLMELLTTIDISEYAEIGPGLFIPHIGNNVIVHSAIIGKHASIHQGVTIGGDG